MKVLFYAAPGSGFNHTLHYRYTDVGEVLGYLSRRRPADRFGFLDGLACPVEWRLLREAADADLLVLFADIPSSPSLLRLARYIRAVAPGVRIAVYGKATVRIPAYFSRPPIDAVHVDGDPEPALFAYLAHLDGGPVPPGIQLVDGPPAPPGIRLHPGEWGFPELSALPLDDYRRVARAKEIPFELSVYPSKGCPHTECRYCDAPRYEGTGDRRRDPEALIRWTDQAVTQYGFDCVQMHSPSFAADPDWIAEFRRSYRQARAGFKWTCCTRTDTLTGESVERMARAGCIRIGIGVETIPFGRNRGPKSTIEDLTEVARMTRAAGVTVKAYIMAGMPGQTERDLLYTYRVCRSLGFIPRVSAYTPFHALEGLSAEALDRIDLARWDRKSYAGDTPVPHATVLRLAVRPEGIDRWVDERLSRLTGDDPSP